MNKHTVDEKIGVVMATNDKDVSTEYKEFIEKLEDMYNRNKHLSYEKFNVTLTKDPKNGYGLVFTGTREETSDEKKKRETAEEIRRKNIEEAELKEYLRLKKKYGSKE